MMPKLTIDKTLEWYLLYQYSILRKRGYANEELVQAVKASMMQDDGNIRALPFQGLWYRFQAVRAQ